MFYLLFGKFLSENNILSNDAINEANLKVSDSRLRLGLIAVAEGLLTSDQAEEVHRLQALQDKRFGDIAVEKGYLTKSQVEHLLSMQGNTYLKFVQALVDAKYMTLEEINTQISEYQKENGYSEEQMNVLKKSDIDDVLDIILALDNPLYKNLLSLAIRNLVRFIDSNVFVNGCYKTDSYEFQSLASQKAIGDHNILLGFSGSDTGLIKLANTYAKEEFVEMDADSYDAICEFINCINGIYASKLSTSDIMIDMLPPNYYKKQTIKSSGLVVVPVTFHEYSIDLIVSIDAPIEFQ